MQATIKHKISLVKKIHLSFPLEMVEYIGLVLFFFNQTLIYSNLLPITLIDFSHQSWKKNCFPHANPPSIISLLSFSFFSFPLKGSPPLQEAQLKPHKEETCKQGSCQKNVLYIVEHSFYQGKPRKC
uniref:Uncharacterized protein n=1 Tax=Molossus molossus TaxID=27622 RepID=A0A7J8GQV3_MOLMO|nr:hypothetical protein HJG59_011348 [Molossus molossus]